MNGFAGTGKSFLTNKLVSELEKLGINNLRLAPTNTAARIIDGQTPDKFYNTYCKCKNKLSDKLKDVKYAIVGEVSMAHRKHHGFLVLVKKAIPRIHFILIGDYKQFKPVKGDWPGDYENSSAVHCLCDGNKLLLYKCRRANEGGEELFDLYKSAVDGKEDKPTVDMLKINLALTRNSTSRSHTKHANV